MAAAVTGVCSVMPHVRSVPFLGGGAPAVFVAAVVSFVCRLAELLLLQTGLVGGMMCVPVATVVRVRRVIVRVIVSVVVLHQGLRIRRLCAVGSTDARPRAR